MFLAFFDILANMTLKCQFQSENPIGIIHDFQAKCRLKASNIQESYKFVSWAFLIKPNQSFVIKRNL